MRREGRAGVVVELGDDLNVVLLSWNGVLSQVCIQMMSELMYLDSQVFDLSCHDLTSPNEKRSGAILAGFSTWTSMKNVSL